MRCFQSLVFCSGLLIAGPFAESVAAPPAGVASPSFDVVQALDEAIQDEYRAFETYARVLRTFGEVRPFSMIVNAERRHIDALSQLYRERNLEVPASRWTAANVPTYATLQAACAAGVESERRNIAMYDRLLTDVLPPEVREVFGNLQRASRENHLPAFERCG